MRSSTKFNDGGSGGRFDDSNIIKQKDFEFDIPNVFRIIGTNIPVRTFFYPTMRQDKETGGMKSSFNGIRVPIKCESFRWEFYPTIIDEIVTLDTRVRNLKRQGGSPAIKSKLKPGIKYLYPVFDMSKNDNVVYYLEASWQVHDGICKLQKEVYDRDPSKLLHGPIFVSDIVITKKQKQANQQAGKQQHNTMYTVRSASGNPFSGKYPKAILDVGNEDKLDKLFDLAVQQGIYTQEQFDVITAHNQDEMAEKYKPLNKDEIEQQLLEYPIQLDGSDWEGRPWFPSPELYFNELKTLGLSYSIGGSSEYNENQLSYEDDSADFTSANNELDTEFTDKVESDLPKNMEVKEPVVKRLPKEEVKQAVNKTEPIDDMPDFLRDL